METFDAMIESGSGGGAFVAIPASVVAALGGGGRIPVTATFDGVPYSGSVVSMGAGPCLGIRKDIRATIGKQPGDVVTVTVVRDGRTRAVAVPDDLADALESAGLRATFDATSYTFRREQTEAVNNAKRAETRIRRIAKCIEIVRDRNSSG